MRKLFFNLFAWALGGLFILLGIFIFGFVIYAMGSALYSGGKWVVNYAQSIPLSAEMREKYPIIGDQNINQIIVKQISGEAKCLDSYNNLEMVLPVHQLFVAKPDNSAMEPLTRLFRSDTGDEARFAKDGFDKNYAPRSCSLYPLGTPEAADVGTEHQIEGRCSRSESLSKVLSKTIGEGFFIRDNDSGDRLRTSLSVERNYNVSCSVKVKKTSPCLSSDYEPIAVRANITEQLLSPFYEYNFCDHPEHEEFISQVRDRWSNALEKK